MATDWVLTLAQFFETQEYIAFLLVFAAAEWLFPRKKTLTISAVLTIGLSYVLKLFFHQARPCFQLAETLPVACPTDFGFPSGHAAAAGLLILGSLGRPVFWLAAPLALFIGYSRLLLGVHTTEQVLAGFALSAVVYLSVWLWRRKE